MTRRATGLLCSSQRGEFDTGGQVTAVAGNSGSAFGRVVTLVSMAQAISALVQVVRHKERPQSTRPIRIFSYLRFNHSSGLKR
jgi:hypothetical protein